MPRRTLGTGKSPNLDIQLWIAPHIDRAPNFLFSLNRYTDRGQSRVRELFVPRRVVVPDLRPRCYRIGCVSGLRYARRARKLSPAREAEIPSLAGTKGLRSLAADFGVSDETIRANIWPGRQGTTEHRNVGPVGSNTVGEPGEIAPRR
jgi:hypothetical protein